MATPLPSTAQEPPAAAPRPRRRWGRRIARALLLLAGLLLLLAVGGFALLHHQAAISLPRLRGQLALPGLAAPVTVERDALGVPTLRAESRLDAARALGFVHAQERFFQMDMLRRAGAGEFAELVGRPLLALDRNRRVHRFRSVAARTLAQLPPRQREMVEAYTAGVNAGLMALGGKPFEYLLLRAEPQPWRAEDTFLAIYAMYFFLNDADGEMERELQLLHDRVPPQLYAFLQPTGTEWDAPLTGPVFATPPIPGPEVFDLRRAQPPKAAALDGAPRPSGPCTLCEAGRPRGPEVYGRAGSNSWAVSGAHTADGHALLANDMHLGIQVPNTWYRVSWTWREPDGTRRRVTGVTLPGVPALAVGSTGRIAWGFSNSFADVTDLIDLQLDPHDPHRYRTPDGMRQFEHHHESIRIHGAPAETLDVADTIWGPVINRDGQGRPRQALAWTAHFPEATNLGLLDLEGAASIDEAIELAHAAGITPQSFVVADAAGRVGWTIIGKLPRRIGWSGELPSSWADGTHRWAGWLPSAEVPKVVDPPSGRIWAANNRPVDGEMLARMGDGGYDLGARARQIRDGLLTLERATPRDLLALQLDNRALFLERWRGLLLQTLSPGAVKADPGRGELRRLLLSTWTGRASVDSVAYRLVRKFRDTVEQQVFGSLAGLKPDDGPASERFEGALWRLVTERPAHLLDRRFRSWDALLLAAADDERRQLLAIGPHLAERTWGERNTIHIRHPLSRALPPLSAWLDMPAHQIPGDLNMPRMMGDAFGASERMVVSPGHEEDGIFHMPDGESGDPLSPHYRDGHTAWQDGRPTPFLPGPAVDVLELVPG